MQERIRQALKEIEETEHIRILLAVESGSRAWGFPSTDSDYDVRFIYIRRPEDYLRLEKMRDVIERPIDDLLDINGWDLQKALRLLRGSNPTLFEWFASPIVYQETEFADRFRKLMTEYFSSKRSLYHYISMANSNYREYLRRDMARVKKYFYVLRPVLASRWILDKGTPPPMLFAELAKAELPDSLQTEVERLLDLKQNSPEIKEIPRVDAINNYLDESIAQIQDAIEDLEETASPDWERLNQLFWEELNILSAM